mgnify:CR=1 FL=1
MNNKYILENNYDISHTIETSSQSSTVRVTDEKFTPMQITFRLSASLLYLFQSFLCCSIHFEFKDIDVILHLQRTIHPSVALAVLAMDGGAIYAYQSKQ